MDQSNKAMSVFRVFDDINAECDEAEAERREQAQGKRHPRISRKEDARR